MYVCMYVCISPEKMCQCLSFVIVCNCLILPRAVTGGEGEGECGLQEEGI